MTYLRCGRGTYANVRPIRWLPGLPSPLKDPEGIDYMVRENLEDLYSGIEGDLPTLLASGLDARPWGGAIDARYTPHLDKLDRMKSEGRLSDEEYQKLRARVVS